MIELTEAPIDVAKVLASVTDPACGAEVLFVGTTRQWTSQPNASQQHQQPSTSNSTSSSTSTVPTSNHGPPTTTLETSHLVYDAYREMALDQLERLESQARLRWPIRQVVIVHRLGRVEPTEPSIAIAVSCPHRREAFEAAQWLIDTIKHEVPIWKQEHYVQGSVEWIHPTSGSCNCHPSAADENANPLQSDQTGGPSARG